MAFSLVWSLGYIISLIVFSVIVGLIFHFNETSKKTLAIYVVISLVFTSAVVYLINLFKNQLYSAIGVYNYTFLFLIAFVLIFSGYLLSKEKKFKDSFKKVLSLSYLCFLLIVFVCILSKTDLLGLNSLQLCLFTAILFNLLVATIFFLVKKFSFNRSFTVLRDLFFVFGLYFLIVSLLLPNIISLDMNDMRPINIASVESMVVTFVFLIAVAVLGLWYYRKNTLFKK
ncbi:MAG: hypothetical protein IJL02_12210 [Methanobrevibacter sp.]|uniref:DUF2162 family putative transporter n=1 Tax=Methanobrevibacter sp. TaxID=66852 RepID=UPI0025CE018A|nr:DUF2162 family putative transporter [Methanobrevibacter sp.]MBQ6100580.1 hypothetical protein [Methanobrevibacter sp.]MBQ6100611.1 hypothetical protein [Methanobrevibacter sp.]